MENKQTELKYLYDKAIGDLVKCSLTGIKINLYNGIRHSLGGQLMDQGVELEMVRDILGHTNSNMTRRYAKRSVPVMTRVLEFRGRPEEEKRPHQNTDKAVI
jgi:site-specific recombinase XerD